ncbi:MAG: heavy metal-responsive transcriptional regulator [Candidatus Binatia bacterium]
MRIGQVAKASGLGIETIRFYEKKGLIEEPARRVSGYREYEEAVVPRLLFVRQAKNLGFTLREIKELLALRLDREASCGRVKRQAEAKIADIEMRMKSLRRMKRALETLSSACDERAPTSECPILAALDRNNGL